MKKILNWISTKLKKTKKFFSFNWTKAKRYSATEILLNLADVAYDELSIDQLAEYGKIFDVLENQFEQLAIDFKLGFISEDNYNKRLKEWKKKFKLYHNDYISKLNVSFA